MSSKIIVLAGLPKAGKSLLSGGLYDLLREKRESFFIERLSRLGRSMDLRVG